MSARLLQRLLLIAGCASAGSVTAQGPLDELGPRLAFGSAPGPWAQLSVTSEVTVYGFDEPPPGLVFTGEEPFVAPRIGLTADAGVGERTRLHALVRADRGFDPGREQDGDVRFDELFVQIDLFDRLRGRLEVGRFATAFGGWVGRHQAWDNPLVTAPALYDDMVPITPEAAPADPAAFAARRDNPENKDTWVPVVWGPVYATGAAFAAGAGAFDLTLEVKNTALSAAPERWDDGFDTDPTFTGRLTWHPRPDWLVGVSLSDGPYLDESAEPTLPPGTDVDDYAQTTWGIDLTYERHHLQLWAELAGSRFEVPGVGDAELLGGFLELRYKPAPRLWLAGRINHTRFDDVHGLERPWDRHLSRLDLAVGYRHSAHLQAKLEYSVGEQAGRDSNGDYRLAGQLVLWF
ncbi:MAG TPA: hypothetical protein VF210_11135 [Pseudomonadales bacterium]